MKAAESADIRSLLDIRTPYPAVVSVYLRLPLDPAGLARRPTLLNGVLAPVEKRITGESRHDRRRGLGAALDAVRARTAERGRDWLGHTVALFSTGERGVFQELRLPGSVPATAVLDRRPYVRPALVSIQRHPAYCAVVIDARHARLLRVGPGGIEVAGELAKDEPRASAFAGWYGLEEYRLHNRMAELVRRHYTATIRALQTVDHVPVVVAGHRDEMSGFLALLPAELRNRVAGTTVVDPHTATPAQIRDRADAIVGDWELEGERAAVADALDHHRDTVTGLAGCLTAAARRAIGLLLVPDGLAEPGFTCDSCGLLFAEGGLCPADGQRLTPVTDIVAELAVAVTNDGGRLVWVAPSLLDQLTARLRFPLA